MEKPKPPKYQDPAFVCPHCGAFTQQNWARCFAEYADGQPVNPEVAVAFCWACKKRSIWRQYEQKFSSSSMTITRGELVYPPTEMSGPTPNPDMPENVETLFSEASVVAALSPRSASVLLRMALEQLLQHLYPKQSGSLNDMIGAAVKDGLPRQLQQTMDVLRFSGNHSIHEFHDDDTQETAATLFDLLNFVVERLITQPGHLDALYEGLPDGFKNQVNRRDSEK